MTELAFDGRRIADRGRHGPSVAIIGGGPGGLSAARLLKEQGLKDVTVFEAEDRVGGKSLSVPYRGARLEMGTCYSTLDHKTTNRWMREFGMAQYKLGRQMMDGVPFTAFIREGPGPSLPSEGWRYIEEWRRFMKAMRTAPDDPAVRAEASQPLSDWLEERKFFRMQRFMLRGITAIGYGYVNEISAWQGLRWASPSLLFSGLLNQLKMPVDGWQNFWERVAEDLDVRRGEPVTGVERTSAGVELRTPLGEHRFDHLLVTIPLDDFGRIAELSNSEREISDSIDWGCYTASLVIAENWFRKYETESFKAALTPGAAMGRLLSARRERRAYADGEGGRVYLCAQFGIGMSKSELALSLKEDIEAQGARLRALIFQKPWKYHPRYKHEAVRDGLLGRMEAIQGARNTWYSGATFSHEAVSAIVAHNVPLTARMAAEARSSVM